MQARKERSYSLGIKKKKNKKKKKTQKKKKKKEGEKAVREASSSQSGEIRDKCEQTRRKRQGRWRRDGRYEGEGAVRSGKELGVKHKI